MGKGKLAKFADIAANPLVVEPRVEGRGQGVDFPLRGQWGSQFFHNSNPIVLELGCGRGEYTVGMAAANPNVNYIGVDIKGARIWTGAQDALRRQMPNVGFLRANIEFIPLFFAPGEVSELWLTFSDPQMKKATKRLTSTHFMLRYRHFMPHGGLIHVKTDSNFLFTYTAEMLRANGITPEVLTADLYAEQGPDTAAARAIQTYYEGMWRERGIAIKYLRFRLPQGTPLAEPDVEIPMDEYRSYHREKRSPLTVSK